MTQVEFKLITKQNYMFKFGSFCYRTGLSLFTSYLINLLFSHE